MRRLVLGLVVAGSGLLAACGGGEVVVQAALRPEADEAAEPTPLPNFEIRALPYDRDAIFDSLRTAHTTPEPEIPDSLAQVQTALVEAQEQLAEAEARWGSARDSLKTLSDLMQSMSRGSAQYVVAYRDFNAQEAIEQQQRRLMDQANQRYSTLLNAFNEQSEAIRAQRQAWGDEALGAVTRVIGARLEERGATEVWDTTDGNGVVRFQGLKKGDWWIHARYDLPYTELYWNVPVQVEGGDPITLVLSRQNAQVRPKL